MQQFATEVASLGICSQRNKTGPLSLSAGETLKGRPSLSDAPQTCRHVMGG